MSDLTSDRSGTVAADDARPARPGEEARDPAQHAIVELAEAGDSPHVAELADEVAHARQALEAALSENVTVLEYEGRHIYLVGTAHVSRASVEEVRRVIEAVQPDTVCVELDQLRFDSARDESRWRKLDIFQVIRERKVLYFLASLALTAYQRRIGDKLGVKPGAEMLEAVRLAEQRGAELVLADRSIQATLKRSYHNLGFFQRMALIGMLVESLFQSGEDEITEETIEQIKERDALGQALVQLAEMMPGLREPLIDERDRFLMSSVQEAPGRKIVAVVGALHVAGMQRHLGERVDRDALEVIPTPSLVSRSLKWVIPTIVLAAFYWGYRQHAGEGLERMIYAWVLPNAVAAALFSAAAGARPLTVLTALVASPITSLNPTIGAGMAAGLVEAWLRRPTVEDCEGLNEAIGSIRGVYGNRFTRVLLVAVGATLGSALGAWIGATWVVALL